MSSAMASTPSTNGPAVRHAQFADESQINPVAYALENSWLWKHSPSRSHSRTTSHANTPAPSKPASVHEDHSNDANINPVAYALENSWLWKHSPSRSHSRAASRHQTPAASKRPSMEESHAALIEKKTAQADADINPVAYAMQNSWLWKHSPF